MMADVFRLYGLLFLADLVLTIVALIDCLSTDEWEVRNLPKVVWVFLILLFSPIGPIVWFVAGRPQRNTVGRGGDWRPGRGFPEYDRPRPAPRADPAQGEDEELFARWEADLRRREEELRRREREQGAGPANA